MSTSERSPAVAIEQLDAFDDGGSINWRDYKRLLHGKNPKRPAVEDPDTDAVVQRAYLDEEHHRHYGRPWAMGRYIFDFVLGLGLRPSDALLDFGCGALRFGIHAIEYLDPGRYFGVDAHRKSLEAASTYEIPLHRLEEKRPRLLWNDRCEVEYFRQPFDWIVDFSTSIHVPEDDVPVVFARLAAALAPEGRLLVAPSLRASQELLDSVGLKVASVTEQRCALLEGHDFSAENTWFELVRSK